MYGRVEKTNKSELWNRLTHSTIELVLVETIIVGVLDKIVKKLYYVIHCSQFLQLLRLKTIVSIVEYEWPFGRVTRRSAPCLKSGSETK